MIEEVVAKYEIDTSGVFSIQKPYFFRTHNNTVFQLRDFNKRSMALFHVFLIPIFISYSGRVSRNFCYIRYVIDS